MSIPIGFYPYIVIFILTLVFVQNKESLFSAMNCDSLKKGLCIHFSWRDTCVFEAFSIFDNFSDQVDPVYHLSMVWPMETKDK